MGGSWSRIDGAGRLLLWMRYGMEVRWLADRPRLQFQVAFVRRKILEWPRPCYLSILLDHRKSAVNSSANVSVRRA
jgi:hypothetical protein